jgi:hypothetical protein
MLCLYIFSFECYVMPGFVCKQLMLAHWKLCCQRCCCGGRWQGEGLLRVAASMCAFVRGRHYASQRLHHLHDHAVMTMVQLLMSAVAALQ